MIRLTLTLPAPVDELRVFVEACERLGLIDVATDLDTLTMVATLGQATPTVEAAPPAAPPAPAAKAPKAAKRAAKKAPAKKRAASGGDTAQAIIAALQKMGGRWNGSASAFVKHAGLGHHALNVLPKLAIAGRIRLLKPSPTARVTAIELVDAASNVTALPQPVPRRHPANPAPLPAGGIKPPSGGWA